MARGNRGDRRRVHRHDVPARLARGAFTTATGVAHASRGALAGPGYRAVLRGVHVAAALPLDHGVLLDAVRLLHPDGPLVGPSAAWALGCQVAGPSEPVHLATGSRGGSRGQEHLVRHRIEIPPGQLTPTRWGPATCPARTALDLARGVGTSDLGFTSRVAWVDALVRRTSLTTFEARDLAGATTGLPGLVVGRRVIRAARDGVDSPRETALRLLVLRHGFPEPVTQCPVVDHDGSVVARLDLGWPDHMAGLEYDGAVHDEPRQRRLDRARHNRIRALDWRVLQVDKAGLARPGAFLEQLASLVPRRSGS